MMLRGFQIGRVVSYVVVVGALPNDDNLRTSTTGQTQTIIDRGATNLCNERELSLGNDNSYLEARKVWCDDIQALFRVHDESPWSTNIIHA